MTDENSGGLDRRQTLKCMLWAGTGVVWTVVGGVPASRLVGSAKAAEGRFSFVQISDSHIGFAKPANPDARANSRSRHREDPRDAGRTRVHDPHGRRHPYRQAERVRRRAANDQAHQARRPLRPGRARHPRSRRLARRISTASARARPAAAGMPSTTAASISCRWSMWSISRRTASARSGGAARVAGGRSQGQVRLDADRALRPYPPVDGRAGLGLGHRGLGAGAQLPRAFRLGDRSERPHPSVDAEGRRERHVPHRALDRLPAAGAGTAPSPGPKVVPAGELRKWLGVREVAYTVKPTELAVTNSDLA